MLLHRSRRDIGTVADRVWYPIWDRGIRLDHSVRTVKEAVSAADGDLKVALGLLDARHVAGDPKLTADLRHRVGVLWRKRAKKWIPELRAAALERHERFGESAFLLEPELKEGRGGLRDIALLRSLDDVTTVLGDLIAPLDRPYRHLTEIRAALHVRTGRALDRLLLQEQDGVAEALGLRDADALLGRVSAAASSVAFVWDDCWRRIDGWVDPRRRGGPRDRPLAPGISLTDGEVHVHGQIAQHWLAGAALAAEVQAPLARSTLKQFVDEVPSEINPWPFGWRQSFVALLGAGHHAIPVIEALDHHGLLVRLIPQWKSVQAKAQRNAYHRFTVDRHLLEAVAQAAALTRHVSRPDLLLLGALLHDIGKGYPGDHTDVGVELVRTIGPRMGLNEHDTAVLARLVEHHLLLADTATRRDVDDPETAEMVAAAVGDRETLQLLAALTEADSLATGPAAWSDWKARLVARLVERATSVLAGHRLAEPDIGALVPPFLEDGVHGRSDRCIVVMPDRPRLLATVSGVLALHGIDVLAATVGSMANGRAVEIFDIAEGVQGPPVWDRVRADVEAALQDGGPSDLAERLAVRARSYARRDAALAAPPRVLFDNDASSRATVVEVRAPDGVGVLHDIACALADAGVDIRSARVSTLGHEVVDAFYVVDRASGAKVADQEALAAIRERIVDALAAHPPPGQNVDESTRST